MIESKYYTCKGCVHNSFHQDSVPVEIRKVEKNRRYLQQAECRMCYAWSKPNSLRHYYKNKNKKSNDMVSIW